jgi:hypothetical protein
VVVEVVVMRITMQPLAQVVQEEVVQAATMVAPTLQHPPLERIIQAEAEVVGIITEVL